VNVADEDYDDEWLSTQVAFVERQLRAEFRHPAGHIAQAVAHATDRFRDAPVRNFLPMLIGRTARQAIRGQAQHPRRVA